MKKTTLVTGVILLSAMVAVSGCNKKTRKDGPTVDTDSVTTSGTGTEFGPDGQPLGEWQGGEGAAGAAGDLLSQTRIYFEYDSSSLTAEGQAIIEAHAGFLNGNSVSVVLEGHVDERGTREYNLALGERRAMAAADVLMALGIDSSRIETVSYGEENPIAEGHDESAWSMNRRVEIRYGN